MASSSEQQRERHVCYPFMSAAIVQRTPHLTFMHYIYMREFSNSGPVENIITFFQMHILKYVYTLF